MNPPTRFQAVSTLSFLLLALLAGCDESSHPLAEDPPDDLQVAFAPFHSPVKDPVTVMSRNLYHGGDIGPVLAVGFSDLALLTETAAAVWSEIQANDFNERVVALVDEIEEAMPDIIGLQELALFDVSALNFGTMEYDDVHSVDFQKILEEELESRGLPYSFIAVQENTVVKVPVSGFPTPDRYVPTELVQLTLRDGVLVRSGMQIDGVSQGNYQASKVVGIGPGDVPIEMFRGWIRVDATIGSVPHHFVNTHMEIQAFSDVQADQTEELLAEIAADLDGVTVLMGDFNSDAAASEGDRSWTPTYGQIRAAGFSDAWAMANPGKSSAGLTCCNDSDLRNTKLGLNERIDFIFLRAPGLKGPQGHFPGAMAVEIIGDDAHGKTTPSGLWPSDHAGLVANLWWAPGQVMRAK